MKLKKGIVSRFPFLRSGRSNRSVLNGTHWFWPEWHSALPLQLAKAREFGELWREKCTRAPWTFPFIKLARTGFVQLARMDKWKAT